MKKNVVFLGSYMHCIFTSGDRIPQVGETLTGEKYFVDYSGKGSSQAMMCARMGSETKYIGRVGADKEGEQALKFFEDFRLIETNYIKIDPSSHTGIAIIITDSKGNNAIMVVPGVNNKIQKEDIDTAENILRDADIMGFVLETNKDMVEYGIKKAYSMGIKTFLDPSPAQILSEDVYPCITYIKPNEHEAFILTGINVVDASSAVLAGEYLLKKGVKNVIITLGGDGVVLVTETCRKHFKAPSVEVLDTTSAGDVFGGTMLAMLNQGSDIEEALIYASCAGALATTVVYPILDVLPMRDAVERKVQEYIKEHDFITNLI